MNFRKPQIQNDSQSSLMCVLPLILKVGVHFGTTDSVGMTHPRVADHQRELSIHMIHYADLINGGLYDGIKTDQGVIINNKLFVFETRHIGNEDYTDLEPEENVPSNHVGWMYDGAKVIVDHELYKVRSRAETSQEYEMLNQ